MTGIYKITNPNGKVYIGQSVDIERRFVIHKKRHKTDEIPILYRSFKKYGIDNHTFEVIEECKINELNERERFYQEKYNCIDEGLNCSYVKSQNRSGRMSDKTRKKMSVSHKGKKHSEEVKIKISKAHKGISRPHMKLPLSEQTKKKMSDAKVGKKRQEFSQEWKDNISKSNKGRKLSDIHKRRIGDAHRGRKDMNGENNGMFGKKHTDDTKDLISNAIKLAWKKKSDDYVSHNAKQVIIDGVTYKSVRKASFETGISPYLIKKYYL